MTKNRKSDEALPRDRRVCFVSGNFNVLHPGHMRLFRFAAELGDFLLVGVNPDSTPGVTVAAAERLENLKSLSLVNEAVLLDRPAAEFIAKVKPAFVIKGSEFEQRENPEQSIVEAYGGRLVFGSGETMVSSIFDLELTERVSSAIRKPLDYLHRHGFTTRDLHAALSKISGIRVMVIGDLIVDDYVNCDPLGMSQEDPTIVVTPVETKTFVGGAGVVAAHARGLGASVRFFTIVGQDDAAAFAYRFLQEQGVGVHAFTDDTRPTTRKQRYRAAGKTLLRVNHLRQHGISQNLGRQMLAQIEEQLPHVDLVLFSDFNYGCLPQSLVDAVTERAGALKIPMAADSQASSQMSDIARFKGMTLITPTEREARLSLRDATSGLAVLAEELVKRARAETVVITLGAEGLLVHARDGAEHYTDRLPAMNTAPKDVAGAGDSLFTATSLALCAGVRPWESVYLGSLAAACQTGRVGNSPLKISDLSEELGPFV